MADQFKNMMIGIFVIAAFAIIIFIMLFLHPNIGNEGKTLIVRFADIDKITPGTRVTFAGKPIGEVLHIKEIDSGERVVHNGIVYIYELELAIDSGIDVYETDEITSRTSGLLGEKSVSIMPMLPPAGEKLVPIANQVSYANDTGSVESTLKEFQSLSGKIEVVLDDVIKALDTLQENKTWDYVANSVKNVNDMLDSLVQGKAAEHLANTSRNFDEISLSLNKPVQISNILDNLSETTNCTKNILGTIQRGEGSIGKILVKDDFYLRLSSLLSKGEVVLNDINHYGILFHLDKGWQRLRARRLNLLSTLSTPQEFRNFFNDEIDSIAVTLERVAMVLQEVDLLPCQQNLWDNPCYVKVYAELLRRVAMLEEYLQMYNQQVVDTVVEQTEFINLSCEGY